MRRGGSGWMNCAASQNEPTTSASDGTAISSKPRHLRPVNSSNRELLSCFSNIDRQKEIEPARRARIDLRQTDLSDQGSARLPERKERQAQARGTPARRREAWAARPCSWKRH